MSNTEITIYHNPRCSKSRQTLEILTGRGLSPTIIRYLENPPSIEEFRELLSLLQMTPRELLRTTESEYRETGLDDLSVDDETILKTLNENPILMQRPIVVLGNQAVIGRPPENVLQLLD